MATDRVYGAMVTFNGNPLIIGGWGGYDTSETFNPADNSNWGRMDQIPIAGSDFYAHSALVLANKVWTFGGYMGNGAIDRVDNC